MGLILGIMAGGLIGMVLVFVIEVAGVLTALAIERVALVQPSTAIRGIALVADTSAHGTYGILEVTELRLFVPETGKRLLPLPIAAWHATVGMRRPRSSRLRVI